MASTGEEPVGSMEPTRHWLACRTVRSRCLKLLQAAVRAVNQSANRSHPRRDGDVAGQLHRDRKKHLEETPENCHTLKLPNPILTNRDLEKLRRVRAGICSPTRCCAVFALPTERRASSAHLMNCVSGHRWQWRRIQPADSSDRGVNKTTLPFRACWPGGRSQLIGQGRDSHASGAPWSPASLVK